MGPHLSRCEFRILYELYQDYECNITGLTFSTNAPEYAPSTQPLPGLMMTSSNGNVFRVTGLVCVCVCVCVGGGGGGGGGDDTGHRYR